MIALSPLPKIASITDRALATGTIQVPSVLVVFRRWLPNVLLDSINSLCVGREIDRDLLLGRTDVGGDVQVEAVGLDPSISTPRRPGRRSRSAGRPAVAVVSHAWPTGARADPG